jgi:hypothetical protein
MKVGKDGFKSLTSVFEVLCSRHLGQYEVPV